MAFCSSVSYSNVELKVARAANSCAVCSAQYVLPVPGGPYRITCPLRSSIACIRAGIPVKRGGATVTLVVVVEEVENGEATTGILLIGDVIDDVSRMRFSTSRKLTSFFSLYTEALPSGSGNRHSSNESHSTARR